VLPSKSVPPSPAPIATGWSDRLPGGIRTHWRFLPFHGTRH